METFTLIIQPMETSREVSPNSSLRGYALCERLLDIGLDYFPPPYLSEACGTGIIDFEY